MFHRTCGRQKLWAEHYNGNEKVHKQKHIVRMSFKHRPLPCNHLQPARSHLCSQSAAGPAHLPSSPPCALVLRDRMRCNRTWQPLWRTLPRQLTRHLSQQCNRSGNTRATSHPDFATSRGRGIDGAICCLQIQHRNGIQFNTTEAVGCSARPGPVSICRTTRGGNSCFMYDTMDAELGQSGSHSRTTDATVSTGPGGRHLCCTASAARRGDPGDFAVPDCQRRRGLLRRSRESDQLRKGDPRKSSLGTTAHRSSRGVRRQEVSARSRASLISYGCTRGLVSDSD